MFKNFTLATPTLEAMRQSDYLFYLTGSYFFGGVTEHSDIDFFVEIPNTTEEPFSSFVKFLSRHDFIPDPNNYKYADKSILAIYRREFREGLEPPIHIQVVKDAAIKNVAQEILKAQGMIKPSAELWERTIAYCRKMADKKAKDGKVW
jgi:predicted nucleotidyltransferase